VQYIRHFYNILISLLPEWKSNHQINARWRFPVRTCVCICYRKRGDDSSHRRLFSSRVPESLKKEKESQVCRTQRREKYFVLRVDKLQTCKVDWKRNDYFDVFGSACKLAKHENYMVIFFSLKRVISKCLGVTKKWENHNN